MLLMLQVPQRIANTTFLSTKQNAGELTAYHCIIHQKVLCGNILQMEHVMSSIKQVFNFITAKGLNHRQFKSFLKELDSKFRDLPYHTEVRWLSRRKVLSRCFETREETFQFMESKEDTAEIRDNKFLCELAFLSDIVSYSMCLTCSFGDGVTSSQTFTQL